MPYIHQSERKLFEAGIDALPRIASPGQLNFILCEILTKYIEDRGGLNYQHINDIVGVLEAAKLEFYRRVAVPYEDKKMSENGDIRAFIVTT